MASISVAGDTSGSVTLSAPAVAGSAVLTLPSVSGTVIAKDASNIIAVSGVQYREATRILKDGEQIAQTYHRSSLAPASDLTNVPENVVAIANAAWTTEVISAYQELSAKVAALEAK